VEIETAVARKRVEDAETAIKQEQQEMRNAENAGLTTTKPETTFEEMLNAIWDSLSDHASSDHEEDGEDEDGDEEDLELSKLSEDDEPGWVMGTILKTVQHRMERFRQKQIKLDELTQWGCGDGADYWHERDEKYGTTEFKVPGVVQSQMEEDATCSVLTTFDEPLERLDRVPGKLQMPLVTSWTGCSQMRLGLRKPQTHEGIPSFPPAPAPDASLIQIPKHVEPLSYNPST